MIKYWERKILGQRRDRRGWKGLTTRAGTYIICLTELPRFDGQLDWRGCNSVTACSGSDSYCPVVYHCLHPSANHPPIHPRPMSARTAV